jgi:acyl carrier protein
LEPNVGASPDPAFDFVADWVHRHTGAPREHLAPETKIADVLGDSLNLVEFVVEVEDSLGLDLPDTDFEGPMDELQDLANLVRYARQV